MQQNDIASYLQSKGLRDTQSRRMVVDTLTKATNPVSPYDIHALIEKNHGTISPVTVYRIIDVLMKHGLVHKHPCSGKLVLCQHIGQSGAHAFLHCHACGMNEEICHEALSAAANIAARSSKFKHDRAMIELSGTCSSCSS